MSLLPDLRAIVERVDIAGIQTNGFAIILQGAVRIALSRACNRTVIKGHCKIGLQPDGLIVVLHRAIHVSLLIAHKAPTGVGAGRVRLQANRVRVVAERARQVATGFPRIAPIDERRGKPGRQPDGLVIITERAFEVALVMTHHTPIVEGSGIVGLQLNGYGVKGHLFVRISRINAALKTSLCRQFALRHRRSRNRCRLLRLCRLHSGGGAGCSTASRAIFRNFVLSRSMASEKYSTETENALYFLSGASVPVS